MKKKMIWFNVGLRGFMEAGIVAAFAFWGYKTGNSMAIKILLLIIAPVLGFGFWGAVDFHQAGDYAEYLRLTQELIISGLAAFALYIYSKYTLGWILAAVSIFHHALVYMLGEKLLKQKS